MSASTGAKSSIKKVAMLFSGGPAPAANAVISTSASSFIKNGIEVFGMKHGYSSLVKFGPDYAMQDGRDFISRFRVVNERSEIKSKYLIADHTACTGRRRHENFPSNNQLMV